MENGKEIVWEEKDYQHLVLPRDLQWALYQSGKQQGECFLFPYFKENFPQALEEFDKDITEDMEPLSTTLDLQDIIKSCGSKMEYLSSFLGKDLAEFAIKQMATADVIWNSPKWAPNKNPKEIELNLYYYCRELADDNGYLTPQHFGEYFAEYYPNYTFTPLQLAWFAVLFSY